MNITLRLALGFLGAAVPVLAMAAPQNVSNITAVNESGKVRVSWAQLNEPDITAYRIFYSHASILQNGGLYDDFESVDGTVNTHLLQSIPPVNELFVSVLAVNSKGEESPYFFEEARVMLNAGSTGNQTDELRLLNADVISATGVVLHFSHPVTIPQDRAMEAISITNSSGTKLAMRRYVIEGNTVTVHTMPQERAAVYRITIGQVVTAQGSNGSTISLAADQAPVLFMGHPTGTMPIVGQQPTTPVQQTADITQLRLSAQPDTATTYAVEATWQPPTGVQLAGYSVAQTIDGGRTYSPSMTVAATASTIKIPGVPPGNYGIMIKAVYANGSQSRGVTQVINLPGSQAPVGNVSQPTNPGNSTALPNSGPVLWLAVAGLGAFTGAWNLRARRMRTA